MSDDLFDVRFDDVPYELMILWEYVNLLEHQMPTFVEKEKARIWTELGPDNEEIGHHLEAQIEDGVTTAVPHKRSTHRRLGRYMKRQ